jgi:TP901 family phage tail tape measure protein
VAELAHITAVVTATTAQFQAAMAQVNSTVTATATRMGALTASASSFGASAGRIGKTMTKSVTLPVAAAGVASIAMSADFESSMAKVEGLVGVAKKDVQAMGDQARKLGPQYGKSASEAGEALFFITSAGLRGSDAMDVLEASLKASAIGLGDTATIADLATSAMNAYGSATLPASNATDVMIAAVREGKLEASELAGAMGSTLPIASNMGVSFEQVGAAFAAMSRTGTNASAAATQLRGILAALKKPTKQANDTLAQYGLSAQGLRDRLRKDGLLPVLKELTESFGDNEEAQAMVFGNVRALTGVMDLMGASVGTTEQIFSRMTTTLGDTDKAMLVTAETAGFKMAQAWATIKQTLMQFGDALLPVVAMISTGLSTVGRAFSSLPGPIRTVVTSLLLVAAVTGPVLMLTGRLIGAFSGVGGAAGSAATGARGLGAALSFIGMGSGPLGAVIAGVGLGIAALFMFRNTTTSAQRATEAWSQSLTSGAEAQKASEAATKTARAALMGVVPAINAEKSATNNLTTAKRNLQAAIKNGMRDGETEQQYASRMAGLHKKVAEAQLDLTGKTVGSTKAVVDYLAGSIAATDQAQGSLGAYKQVAEQYLSVGGSLSKATASESEKIKMDQAALVAAEAIVNVGKKRQSAITNEVSMLKKQIKAVANSKASDEDKAAATDKLKGRIKGLRDEYDEIAGLLSKNYTLRISTVITGKKPKAAVNGYVGGYIAGFAGGGTVTGPGGKDRVPAMLTAGEVVLTTRQQSLVDSGVSIRDALVRTGGAYAKGGLVKRQAAAKRNVTLTSKALAAAKKSGNKGAIDEAQKAYDNAKSTLSRIEDAIKNRMGVMEPVFQSVVDNISTNTLRKFDDATTQMLDNLASTSQAQMNAINLTFQGGVTKVGGQWVRMTGSIEQAQKDNEKALKGIEDSYKETFREIDESLKAAQAAVNARFDALTPAEGRIKEMEDAASQMSLDKGVNDAQAAIAAANAELAKAQKWGDTEGMKAAQEQLMAARQQMSDAQREQTLANLRKTAEAERAEAEGQREAALTAEQTHYDEQRELKQTAMNEELEAERQKGETSRMILEAQLAEQQTTEAANLATKKAALEEERRVTRSALEDNLQDFGEGFMKLRRMFLGNHKTITNQVKAFARSLKASGAAAAVAFAAGISNGFGAVAGASSGLANLVSQYLQLSSPSEKGPLSTLDHWFDAFDSTLLSGMDARQIEDAIGLGSSSARFAGGKGGNTTVNLTVTDQTFAGMSREQADRVARQVQAALDRRVSFRV